MASLPTQIAAICKQPVIQSEKIIRFGACTKYTHPYTVPVVVDSAVGYTVASDSTGTNISGVFERGGVLYVTGGFTYSLTEVTALVGYATAPADVVLAGYLLAKEIAMKKQIVAKNDDRFGLANKGTAQPNGVNLSTSFKEENYRDLLLPYTIQVM